MKFIFTINISGLTTELTFSFLVQYLKFTKYIPKKLLIYASPLITYLNWSHKHSHRSVVTAKVDNLSLGFYLPLDKTNKAAIVVQVGEIYGSMLDCKLHFYMVLQKH